MADYLDVVDAHLQSVERFRATENVRIEVRVPAQIAEYGSVVTRRVFQETASQHHVTAERQMAAAYDTYTLTGSRDDVAHVLRQFRSDLTEIGTFSGPISGFFLRARGFDALIRFAADQTGVSCKLYGVSYLDAKGPMYKIADFVYYLKEAERQANGALPLFDARQKLLDTEAKSAEKARRKEERRERRRHTPVVKHLVRNREGKAEPAEGIE